MIKLIVVKDNKTWDNYEILLKYKIIKESNYKELCYLS